MYVSRHLNYIFPLSFVGHKPEKQYFFAFIALRSICPGVILPAAAVRSAVVRSGMLGPVPACRLSSTDCSSSPPRAGSNRTPHRVNSRLQSYNWGRVFSHQLELD